MARPAQRHNETCAPSPWLRWLLWAAAALVGSVCLATASVAGQLQEPDGAVVVTIVGDVSQTNRGPFDAGTDKFFGFHELTFERAAAFDRSMLERLGRHTVRVGGPVLGSSFEVSGPRLADVLAAAGAAPGDISVLALDGFRADVSAGSLAARDWIVGIEANGRPLGLGGRGPAWILFAPKDATGVATHDEEMQWPWAAFAIIVGGDD